MIRDKAVLSPHPEPVQTEAATADRIGNGHLKVALVDPSLFTVPYDAKLVGALCGLGHEVVFYGEALARDEDRSGLGRMRGIFYPELLALRARNWPSAAVRVAKGAFHWRGMRRLVVEVRAEAP